MLVLAALGGCAALSLGALGGGVVRGERRLVTAGQSLLGGALATLPGLLALEASPLTHDWNLGMDMALGVGATGLGVALSNSAAGLGTFATGEIAAGRGKRPGAAFLWAFVGALIGSLLGLGVDALLQPIDSDNEAFRWSLSIGLIGAAAAIGHQWFGGGRASRHAPEWDLRSSSHRH